MWLVLVFPIVIAACGCLQPTDALDKDEEAGRKSKADATSNDIQPGERWEAIYLKDTKIGYQHTTIEHAKEGDPDKLSIHSVMSVTFVRSGQATQMKFDVTSSERSDGRLESFHAVQGDGPGRATTKGEVRMGKLDIEAERAGKKTSSAIPWESTWGGMFAIDSSLLRNPMKPGETRQMRVLMPILFQPADVTLKATEFEETKLLDGKKKLLKIQVTFTINGIKLEEVRWVDAKGEAYKSQSPQTQQTLYRTTKSFAMKPGNADEVDVAALNSVPVKRPIDNPHGTKRIVYRASVESGNMKGVFGHGASQTVRLVDDQTAELVVQAVSPTEPAKLANKENAPNKDDLQPNTMIQSDDATIQRIAKVVAVGEKDPWKIALELERFVNNYITEANFEHAFDTAAEVAAKRTGDCTEHSVLLAALCRARKIPARVAIGLVYLRRDSLFAYHMWTEVWIKDRWIPIDATLARGGIGAAHIKLTTSSLTGASPQSVFLPVAQVVGRLKLQVVDVD
jgi:hypothetical protein